MDRMSFMSGVGVHDILAPKYPFTWENARPGELRYHSCYRWGQLFSLVGDLLSRYSLLGCRAAVFVALAVDTSSGGSLDAIRLSMWRCLGPDGW